MPRPELSRRLTAILSLLEAGGRDPRDQAVLLEEFDTLACLVVAEYARVPADIPAEARHLN